MTVSIFTEPTLIMPGRPCEVRGVATVGNFIRVSVTDAPEGSAWKKLLLDEDRTELHLWAADSGARHRVNFDKPGAYVCTIREYTKSGVAFGGDHLGDPDGYVTESPESTATHTFRVGQKMTAGLAFGRDTGTLTLYVWDSTIRPTTVPEHGEASPRIDGDTPRMRTAAVSSSVISALSALENVACDTAAASLGTAYDNLIGEYNDHRTAAVHAAGDADNAITDDYLGATTPDALRNTVTHVGHMMRRHFTNDAGTGLGPGSGGYHTRADWNNLPILSGAGDVLTASLALSSLWHSYETHRVTTASIHTAADTVNVAASLAPLYHVYKAVVAVLTSDNPATPAVDNSGATILAHRAGLTKA